jgi:acid phosphatase (class A)
MRVKLVACELTTLGFVFATLVAASNAPAVSQYYYLDPHQIDLTMLLPPPPDMNSAQERLDQQQVASAVAGRSQAQLAQAEEDAMRNVFFFAKSVGPGFDAQDLPVTTRFFSRVGSDLERLIDQAKLFWERPRPSGALKARGSYPSGHAAFGATAAILLSQLIPSKRDQIFGQARMFAENRILLGVHYPSDVAAGWTAGTVAAYAMMRDPGFQRDELAVRAELQRANFR